ncbi:type II toxin-antitoxin system VapC family toxin [Thioflexithrix psekupsensis]|uniref:PIN domain-containing protein n=1 Tax=Thioflexithrix psekupsensis TaxID=1570016 RepID=A0A251X4R2_9GAMM|nr:type II toxin-antitoxin system VapC family toxin [Thioflexithrix psekupsensis]OUD12088.1 hypothetical protein TPSD3_13230 [Thioflexithrix psekupsensis]
MVAIDTNVLVRVLVEDKNALEQTQLARQFLKRVKQVYVPQIVQVECVWVLERAYSLSKGELLKLLISLYESPVFVLQSEGIFLQALTLFRETQVGFADCLILSESGLEELELVTFDKKLSQMQHCQLLVTELQ